MMFQSLKAASKSIALEGGSQVVIGEAAQWRICETEGLGPPADKHQANYHCRSFLYEWGSRNIKGTWAMDRDIENGEEILRLIFQRKKEAVRFKLTWGGR